MAAPNPAKSGHNSDRSRTGAGLPIKGRIPDLPEPETKSDTSLRKMHIYAFSAASSNYTAQCENPYAVEYYWCWQWLSFFQILGFIIFLVLFISILFWLGAADSHWPTISFFRVTICITHTAKIIKETKIGPTVNTFTETSCKTVNCNIK